MEEREDCGVEYPALSVLIRARAQLRSHSGFIWFYHDLRKLSLTRMPKRRYPICTVPEITRDTTSLLQTPVTANQRHLTRYARFVAYVFAMNLTITAPGPAS